MVAAYWMTHGTQALFPIVNGGELAVLYCFVFLYIAAQGSGIWSVDAARGLVTPNIHYAESQWQVRSKERA
jgi:putative oxidoreductase